MPREHDAEGRNTLPREHDGELDIHPPLLTPRVRSFAGGGAPCAVVALDDEDLDGGLAHVNL